MPNGEGGLGRRGPMDAISVSFLCPQRLCTYAPKKMRRRQCNDIGRLLRSELPVAHIEFGMTLPHQFLASIASLSQ